MVRQRSAPRQRAGPRLDGLYARGAAILDAGVEAVEGSDHWPVWVDVAITRP